MGVLELTAGAVALFTVFRPKSKSKAGAKFAVGDLVQSSLVPDGNKLEVLDREKEPGGWHYQVARAVDGITLPAPGSFRSKWWTLEENLAPWTDQS